MATYRLHNDHDCVAVNGHSVSFHWQEYYHIDDGQDVMVEPLNHWDITFAQIYTDADMHECKLYGSVRYQQRNTNRVYAGHRFVQMQIHSDKIIIMNARIKRKYTHE